MNNEMVMEHGVAVTVDAVKNGIEGGTPSTNKQALHGVSMSLMLSAGKALLVIKKWSCFSGRCLAPQHWVQKPALETITFEPFISLLS